MCGKPNDNTQWNEECTRVNEWMKHIYRKKIFWIIFIQIRAINHEAYKMFVQLYNLYNLVLCIIYHCWGEYSSHWPHSERGFKLLFKIERSDHTAYIFCLLVKDHWAGFNYRLALFLVDSKFKRIQIMNKHIFFYSMNLCAKSYYYNVLNEI